VFDLLGHAAFVEYTVSVAVTDSCDLGLRKKSSRPISPLSSLRDMLQRLAGLGASWSGPAIPARAARPARKALDTCHALGQCPWPPHAGWAARERAALAGHLFGASWAGSVVMSLAGGRVVDG
jgi:hypothetical protein